jgi:hypothetical protein
LRESSLFSVYQDGCLLVSRNGRFSKQVSSDNRPFSEKEKIGIFLSFKLEAASFCNNRDHTEASYQYDKHTMKRGIFICFGFSPIFF